MLSIIYKALFAAAKATFEFDVDVFEQLITFLCNFPATYVK